MPTEAKKTIKPGKSIIEDFDLVEIVNSENKRNAGLHAVVEFNSGYCGLKSSPDMISFFVKLRRNLECQSIEYKKINELETDALENLAKVYGSVNQEFYKQIDELSYNNLNTLAQDTFLWTASFYFILARITKEKDLTLVAQILPLLYEVRLAPKLKKDKSYYYTDEYKTDLLDMIKSIF